MIFSWRHAAKSPSFLYLHPSQSDQWPFSPQQTMTFLWYSCQFVSFWHVNISNAITNKAFLRLQHDEDLLSFGFSWSRSCDKNPQIGTTSPNTQTDTSKSSKPKSSAGTPSSKIFKDSSHDSPNNKKKHTAAKWQWACFLNKWSCPSVRPRSKHLEGRSRFWI